MTRIMENVSELGPWYRNGILWGYYTACHSRYRARSDITTTAQHALRRTHPHVFMPPTPYTVQETGQDKYKGYRTIPPSLGASTSGYFNIVPPPLLGNESAQLVNTALTRALTKLKDQNVNYAQAFAERKQVANLVTDTAKTLFQAAKALKKGNVKKMADILKLSRKTSFRGVADMRLAYVYGAKPLLQDVHGAVEDLRRNDLSEPKRYRMVAKGSKRNRERKDYTIASGNFLNGWHRGLWRRECGASVRLDYYLDNPALAQLAATGFANPASLAWELLPFSFVADWFVPVGAYLNCMDAALGYRFLGGSNTQRYLESRTGCYIEQVPNPDPRVIMDCSKGYLMAKAVNRYVYTTAPSAALPAFKNPFSLDHMANAISLLQGALHGTRVR